MMDKGLKLRMLALIKDLYKTAHQAAQMHQPN